MYESILSFPKQFTYQPIIENEGNLKRLPKAILVGMGGSHLSAGLLKAIDPKYPILIHWDYDLPEIPTEDLKDSLIIISSYSGNTQEALSALAVAKEMNLSIAIITTGGKLLELAKENNLPFIQIPDTHIEPRLAVGLSLRAVAKILGLSELLTDTDNLATSLEPKTSEQMGKDLADKLRGFIPLIYSSRTNSALAYNWKIKFNETSKIPAFYNILPELNHNEMSGFDLNQHTRDLSEKFKFIFIKDDNDNKEIKKRMDILESLLTDKNLPVLSLDLLGNNRLEKLFNSIILADWVTYYLALTYEIDPMSTPLIEDFKRKLN